MPDLVPFRTTSVGLSRIERQAALALDRVRANRSITSAQETGRVDIITEVTEAGLLAAWHISAIESLLADRTPHAEGRLHNIANAGCLGLTDVVLSVSRRV
jgi:hypothetical protein